MADPNWARMVTESADYVCGVLSASAGRPQAWDQPAGTLTWPCRRAIAHTTDCCTWYAALLARHRGLRLVIAHLGMPEYSQFLDLTERHAGVMLDTTMALTDFVEAARPFPRAELPRLAALGDRVLLGTDFPNIPYAYPDALEALERAGLSANWLRAVCHDNAAKLFTI